jgi:LCP family protein required for cell wall assembly
MDFNSLRCAYFDRHSLNLKKAITEIKKKRIRLLVILGSALLLLALALIALFVFWNRPFAAKLALPSFAATPYTPLPPNAIAPTEVVNSPTDNNSSILSKTPTPDLSSSELNLCDKSGTWTILAIGSDYRGDGGAYLYGLADVIRVIRVDFSKGSVSMLAIPRDLWVHIPELADRNIDYGKINQAYFFGTPGMGYYKGKGGGAGLLADTLYYNYGIFPDHYVVVSMNAFAQIIDAVGGIDVTLDEPVDGNVEYKGESDNLGYYSAGTHHFNGETALKFSRIRFGYTELKRIDNQSIILKALYDKMISPEVRGKLLDVATLLLKKGTILTDLSPADLATLICVATSIDRNKIKTASLPSDSFTGQMIFSPIQNDYTFAYVPDNQKVQKVIDQFKLGVWP